MGAGEVLAVGAAVDADPGTSAAELVVAWTQTMTNAAETSARARWRGDELQGRGAGIT